MKPGLNKQNQFLLQLIFWFSIYGLLVSLIINGILWMATGPLSQYLEAAAGPAQYPNTPGLFLHRIARGFQILSAYFSLLLISAYMALRIKGWALGLAGVLVGLALVADLLTIGLIWQFESPLRMLLGTFFWGIVGLLLVIGGFFGWISYQLFRPVISSKAGKTSNSDKFVNKLN